MSVENMERATEFYKKLFKTEPANVDTRMTSFDLNGFYFLLFDLTVDGEEAKFGNNCVPNFKVENAKEEYARIKQFAPTIDDEIQDLGEVKLFQFKDSEGNILEIYE
ncbi:MAG: lactoylglutathione lyase [Candidatus Paceibacterota bacterium]